MIDFQRQKKLKILFALILVLLIMLSGCKGPTNTPAEPKPTEAESVSQSPTEEKTPAPTSVPPTELPQPTDAPTDVPALPALSAEPQRVEFQADDGKNLVGYYYPAASNPAPTVILMHWAGGDERDWVAIAPWLQNRPDELAAFTGWEEAIGPDCEDQLIGPWLDPSWFPAMPEELSFAVFTFDFRDFCESEPGMNDPSEWALDARAAFETVSELEGVDPHQIVAIGASIGADGAPDGCLLHNEESETCQGGFSLSPGSYLNMPYTEVVTDLDSATPAVPVWCLAAKGDYDSPETCKSASGDHFKMVLYEDDAHGLMLLEPNRDPDPMVLIQEFLEVTFGIEIN